MTLTISCANDASVVSGPVLAMEDEDALPILIEQDDLLSIASDVDLADAGALVAENLAISAGAGVLVDNGDGTWTFTPAADDDTEVSFTFDVTDGDETVAATGVIDLLPVNDDPVGTVSISGVAQEASELAVLVSGLADADGLGMLNYQWFADDVAIVGATGLTFTPGQDEVGSILTVEVSYTDGRGTLESLLSAPSLAVLDAAYNFIEGTDASELITGNDGQDAIFALLGDDTLVGGLGGDSLSGGDGFDIVSYADAAERARVDFLN
ncbi:cadherin-like domain-containing protein [Marimonas lutisalis]|uniref:cadherin-like domain-containing protein n=1 Tax=Marimonas lutisalis TaxID=2545756 RepID=UPI001960DA18|nr:cadherin-like domain-containing protein [Marimonas lutisalis]